MGRVAHWSLAWLSMALGACGPESEPIADCDGDGPTQLVRLRQGPSQSTVMNGVRDSRGWLFFDGEGDEGRNLAVECGKPPRVFAHDLSNVFRLDSRGPWFGLRHPPDDGPSFYVVDPWGDAPPRLLPPFFLGVSDDGLLLGRDSRTDGVSLWHAKFGSAFELEPIALDLQTTDAQRASWADVPFNINPVDLVFVSVREGSTTTTIGIDPGTGEQSFSEDRAFHAARMGGRFVILRADDPDDVRTFAIVDTEDPTRRVEPYAANWRCCYGGRDLVAAYRYADDETDETDEIVESHLVTLPDLRELRLAGAWWLPDLVGGSTGDERRVLRGPDGFYLLESGSSVPALIYPHHGSATVADEVLWVWHTGWPHSWAPAEERALVRVPLDGTATTTILEPPLISSLPISRGRWALTRDNRDGRTDLRVYDPTTGREEIAVEDIDIGFSTWNYGGFLWDDWLYRDFTDPPDHDDIIFARTTDDGRSIWRARL
jgi:hypothetical protein